MLNIIFSLVALVFLLCLVAYVLVLMANNSRILSISQEKVDLEGEVLKEKIKYHQSQRISPGDSVYPGFRPDLGGKKGKFDL